MKRLIPRIAAAYGLLVVCVAAGVSQFRTPVDFVRMCRFACPRYPRCVEPEEPCCPKPKDCCCSSQRPELSNTTSTSSPMINVSIAPAYDYGAQRKSRRAHSRYDEDDLEDLAPMLSGRMGKREEKEEVPFYKKVPPSMYAPYGPPRYEFVAPRKKSDWHIGPIGIGYFRYADEALIDYSDTDQSTFGGLFGSGGDSVKTGLSPLWFQKESFYGEELFENGETTPQEEGSAYNPYMATSTLKPTFEYMESAFLIGIHCRYQSCNTMFGFVAGIPYRRSVVTVTAFEEGDLNDVVSDPALDAAGGSEECPSTYDICNASSNNLILPIDSTLLRRPSSMVGHPLVR